MKKRITICLLMSMFTLFAFSSLVSCTDYEDAEMDTYHFNVKLKEWKWNDIYMRYECIKDFSALTKRVYESGAVQAGVYVVEEAYNGKTYEVFKPMPFVQSYLEGDVPYTETISYDVSHKSITFYIQASDLSDTKDYLTNYEYKVNLFRKKD